MKRLVVPAVVTLLAIVSFVALSGWNRSAEPRLRITLTERELALPYVLPSDDEDLGMQLRLDYVVRHDALDARNWLSEEQLRSLGFALDVTPGAPEAGDTYNRALPRIVWVAFEYGGAAWQAVERQRVLAHERFLQGLPDEQRQQPMREETRLVPVDARLDFDQLLRRYPQGHLIVRASIGIALSSGRNPVVYGFIRELIPSQIAVPREMRQRLGGLPSHVSEGALTPRYEIDVAVGAIGVPYITDIRRLGQ